MILSIPLKLDGGLNAREHWRRRHERVLKERTFVAIRFKSRDAKASLSVARGANTSGRWVVTLTRVAPRKLDRDDNLPGRFKSVRDEVAKVLGIDDGSDLLKFHYAQRRGKVREHAIEIEVQSHEEWRVAELDRLLREVVPG